LNTRHEQGLRVLDQRVGARARSDGPHADATFGCVGGGRTAAKMPPKAVIASPAPPFFFEAAARVEDSRRGVDANPCPTSCPRSQRMFRPSRMRDDDSGGRQHAPVLLMAGEGMRSPAAQGAPDALQDATSACTMARLLKR
jgi:hypothetical protein